MKFLCWITIIFVFCQCAMAAPRIEDGTLMHNWNGNRIIQGYTDSKVTHVGIIININEEPYLYEADVPEVRRIKFSDYLIEVAKLNEGLSAENKMRLYLIQPNIPFTGNQIKLMKEYADSKIGKRYSIRGYIHKQKVETGIHCAEFSCDALNSTGRFKFLNTSAVSPKSLVCYMKKIYGNSQRVAFRETGLDKTNYAKNQSTWAKNCILWGWSCTESGKETLHWIIPTPKTTP